MRAVKCFAVMLIFLITPVFMACNGGNVQELYETAQFEELQNNSEHASKLYKSIVKKYPDSEYASMAAERLREMKRLELQGK